MPDQLPVSPHLQIPTRDGTRLSAAVHWPPSGPDGGPYPALVEYHPYRKDDKSSPRAADHEYFALQGFASVRLDVRGTGSSEGINTDEYMAVETADGYDAIEWIASQEWCTGDLGMFGSSYGGFTSYQVAMLQPPSLKAIVPIYATDDRYTDDCHYKGSALKGYYDVATYGTMMAGINALPPDPELFGDDWEAEWSRRLDQIEPYMEKWLSNQRNGDYWRPGSLRGQYEKLKAATFIIGGWQDGYPNPPWRAFQHIECPKKLLIGPWNHSRPDVAIPGPRIDYLHEMRRWFDLHLRGVDDGLSAEPPVTIFVQEFDSPDPKRTETSGSWLSQGTPAPAVSKSLYLGSPDASGSHHLGEKPVVASRTSSLKVDPSVGITGGLWSGGLAFGLPGDQRRDEALSLVYTSSTLQDDLVIVGNPVLEITASSDQPVTLFVAKLADIAPGGASALVSRGVLNGTRRNGLDPHAPPEPMEPHEDYRLRIELDATAWRFSRGHRIRLAISGADFPNMWPAPGAATIRVSTGGPEQSVLTLPLADGESQPSPEFLPSPKKPSSLADSVWRHSLSPLDGTCGLDLLRDSSFEVRPGVSTHSSDSLQFTVNSANASEAEAVGTHTTEITHRGDEFVAMARQGIRSDDTHFHWSLEVSVANNGQDVAKRSWNRSILRDLM